MNDEMVSISITQPELVQIEEALHRVQCAPTPGDPLCQRFRQLADELASRWVAAACAPVANAFTKGLGANEALFGGDVYADGDVDPVMPEIRARQAGAQSDCSDERRDTKSPRAIDMTGRHG